VRDIVDLLDFFLPRRPRTEAELLRRIDLRHQARHRDILRHRRLARRTFPQSILPK
jgi:hypothetical protein